MSGIEGFISPTVKGECIGGVGLVAAGACGGDRYLTSVGQEAKVMLTPGTQAITLKGPTLQAYFQ